MTRSPDEPVLSWPEREGLVAGSLAFSPAAQEEVKRFIARSRAWVGWWEFSARLFRYFDRRCSTLVCHTVAGQLVVTSIRGTYRNTVRSLRKNLMAALALRRR